MSDIDDSEKNLELLIERFNMGAVSAFVGAGFSKNANGNFPEWKQLICPMIDAIYPNEDKKSISDKKDSLTTEDYLDVAEEYEYSKSRKMLDEYITNTFKSYDKNETNNLELHKKLLSLEWNDIFTTNYDTLLEQADTIGRYKIIEEFTTIFDNAVSRRIIKLHGSLNDKKGFDGCKHKYIITETDYYTYHEKHNGFSTIVQSQIAQNSLCLIGFSGDDLNFKSWITWLFSLIPTSTENIKPNPIFFIDVADVFSLDEEKRKLYTDHNIKIIFIKDIVKSIKLVEQTNSNNNEINKLGCSSRFERLNYLFDYISSNVIVTRDYPHIPINERVNYDIYRYSELPQGFDIKDAINFFKKHSPSFDLPRLPSRNLNYIALDGLMALQNIKVNDLSLSDYYTISILIRYMMLPIYCLKDNLFKELIEKINSFDLEGIDANEKIAYRTFMLLALKEYRLQDEPKSFSEQVTIITEKTKNWNMKEEIDNSIEYEECLFFAQKFQIEKFHKKIDDWNIDNCKEAKWYIKKAFLLNIFGYNPESKNLIEKALTLRIENYQERLWLLEIADYYFAEKKDDTILSEINALKQKKYFTLRSLTDYLIEEITKLHIGKDDKKVYLAEVVRNQGKSISLFPSGSRRNKDHYALSLLYLFEEIGINRNIGKLFSRIGWYNLDENMTNILSKNFQKSFIHIYSAFGNDSSENLARKFCQNIIFNKNIHRKDIKDLFDGIFLILKYKIKKNDDPRVELFILSEFTRRLKYGDWKKLVEFLTKKLVEEENNKVIDLFKSGSNWGWKEPFKKIYPLIEEEEIVKKFILFFLKLTQIQSLSIAWNEAINYFHIFQQNRLYKKAIISIFSNDSFLDENINNNSLLFIYKSKCFYEYLKKEDQQKIIEKALEIEATITDKWHLLPFAENEKIIKILLLFINGSSRDFHFSTYYLDIYTTISNKISEADKITIFENFKYSFEKLKSNNENTKKLHAYNKMNDSSFFLILYKLVTIEKEFLNSNDTFNNFFEDVKNYYFSNFMKLDNWKDIILNGNEDDFKSFACNFLYLFQYLDVEKAYEILKNILGRLIYIDSMHHEAIIGDIAGVLSNRETSNDFFKEPPLSMLLYKFQSNIPDIHDRIFIEQCMVYIALILKKTGIDNEQVRYWLNYKDNSEFKEVRKISLKD